MDLTAYRAIEANRWRSRLFAGLNARHPEGLVRALRRMSSVDRVADSIAPRARTLNDHAERLAASLWTVRPRALGASWLSRLIDSHPSTEERIRRIERMS